MKKRLVIFDSNALIHRAFHALPPLTTQKGELVNAVYGFLLVFFKVIREFQPDYIAAAFDFPAPTFRHKKFKEYKAKRPKTPQELCQQIPEVKEVLKVFNIPVFEKEGYEADDIIGTIVHVTSIRQVLPKIETIIISGDLDTLQLIDSDTKVYFLRRGVKDIILYNEDSAKERYQGLNPGQLLDFKALRGDPSDNIPGAAGIGEKTAIKLIKEFGTLENLYQEIEQNSKKSEKIKDKLKEALLRYKKQVFFSKMLATIKKNVSIDFNLKECQWQNYDKEKAITTLKEFNFNSLIKRLPELEIKTKKTKMTSCIRKNLRLW